MYNPKTVETLDGKIESIEKVTAGRMDVPARVLLKLKTEKETVTIYLGPEWYLEKQKTKLSPGDYIQVRGSRVTLENMTMILPNEITKGSAKSCSFGMNRMDPVGGARGREPQTSKSPNKIC